MSDTVATIEKAIENGGVFRVMPENVTPLWPQLQALFVPALAMVSTHTAEDVRCSIIAMRAQLWVQMVLDEVVAAATTEFVEYPAGLFVRVWMVGAIPDRQMDMRLFGETLDHWRHAHGCIGFEAIGRHGWLKRFPRLRTEGLIMRWIVDEGEGA